MASEFTRVLQESELPEGEKRTVIVDGIPVLLCRSGGQLHAISNICSHAHEALDCGRMRDGWIACPVHGARFDLATGEPLNPPATLPIPSYPLQLIDGWIEVKI